MMGLAGKSTGNLLSLVAETPDTHPQEKSIYNLKETPRPPSWLATSPVFHPALSRHKVFCHVTCLEDTSSGW